MRKKYLSNLMVFCLLFSLLSPALIQAVNPGNLATQTLRPSQLGRILDRMKDKAKEKAKEAENAARDRVNPNNIAKTAIAIALSKALDDELPLKHDVNAVLRPIHIPEGSFRPKRLILNARNLDQELLPGDYEIPVTVYCTKGYVSVPGRGVGYALTYMKGKRADAMALLYLRGAQQGVNKSTLQVISWSIQAATPYAEMPTEYQKTIDRLIPEYRRQLEGDFLQTFEGRYNSLTRGLIGSGIPSFDSVTSQVGAWGVSVAEVKRTREIIRANSFNYQLLEQRLVGRTITIDENSPWGEISPGVYARLVMGGFRGYNSLQFRYAPAAAGTTTIGRLLFGLPRIAPLLEIPVLGEVTIITLMAIPIAQAVQSLAISPQLESDYGDCTEEQHEVLQNAVERECKAVRMSCSPEQDCATLRLNIEQFGRCIAARNEINNTCYEGGNKGHQKEIRDRENGLANCLKLYNQQCGR
jgi:hypothetical protein